MFTAPHQYRELVFSFSSRLCQCSHPSGRYDKDLTGGTYITMPCGALPGDITAALNLSWGDTDYGAPYYIQWEFQTNISKALASMRAGNSAFVGDTITGIFEVDGVGSWAATGTITNDPSNPTYAKIRLYASLTASTTIPTGCTYPAPYDVLTVGNIYSGRVRCFL